MVALTVGACGEAPRTADTYCEAFYSTAAPIRQSYVDAQQSTQDNPVGALLKVLQAPGDMVTIFGAMADKAPDEIKSDTEQVRDSFKKLQDTMGEGISNPLGAMGKSLVGALTSAGSMERVSAYLEAHCPLTSPVAQKYIHSSQ